jgi:hypothetical protein
MNNNEKMQLLEFIGKATVEYGCSNFVKNLVLATMPSGTSNTIKFVTLLSGRLMGMNAGEQTADWTAKKLKEIVKAINEKGLVGIIM